MIRDTSQQDVVRDIDPRRRNRRYAIWALLGLSLVAGLAMAGTGIGRWLGTDQTVSAERIRTAMVSRGTFVRDLSVQGRIVAAVSPTLYSPAAGTVSLSVTPGDRVSSGQVLATLESPELRAELEQERAALAGARADLERMKIQSRQTQVKGQQEVDLAQVELTAAEREMRRAERSHEIQVISESDFERRRDELATAKVRFEHARQDAELERESLAFEARTRQLEVERQDLLVADLERRVAELAITSPVDGMVGNVAVNERAVVAANQPLVTVVDLSAFQVEVRIPEAYADDLGPGMPAEIQYNGETHEAELISLSPEVVENEVTGRLRFAGEPPSGLRQNQRVTSRVIVDHLVDVLKLRRGSFTDGGGRSAFVLGEDGVARRRSVRLGARSAAEVQVLDGLTEGEQVIISSISEFADQDTIRVAQ